jgi:HAD superfamily hydrolase (TIGR01509 family)
LNITSALKLYLSTKTLFSQQKIYIEVYIFKFMIQGIIFDMDGVISDTQKLHSKVESELLSRYRIQISPEEITKKYSGVRTKEFFDRLLKTQKIKYDLDLLMKEKGSQMENFASESIDAINGSIELIQRLASKGYPLAVASASNLNYVKTVLKTLRVIDHFPYIISGDMVTKGKPDPESFLLASSKLKIAPENCLVIEDGFSGMVAAIDCGMKCVGLVKKLNEQYPTKNLVTSLSEITQDYINQI